MIPIYITLAVLLLVSLVAYVGLILNKQRRLATKAALDIENDKIMEGIKRMLRDIADPAGVTEDPAEAPAGVTEGTTDENTESPSNAVTEPEKPLQAVKVGRSGGRKSAKRVSVSEAVSSTNSPAQIKQFTKLLARANTRQHYLWLRQEGAYPYSYNCNGMEYFYDDASGSMELVRAEHMQLGIYFKDGLLSRMSQTVLTPPAHT